jgi:hypothetical protein
MVNGSLRLPPHVVLAHPIVLARLDPVDDGMETVLYDPDGDKLVLHQA